MVYLLLVVSRKALVWVIVLAATRYVLLWVAVAGNWAWLDGADNWMLRQFHRVGADRPGWIGFWELILESSPAFPSGHALGVTVAVLAFITLACPHLHRAMRGPVAVLGLTTMALVGLARVALNVDHPSDVLAGWALGSLYFLLCIVALQRWVPRSRARHQDPDLVSAD